MVKPFFTPLQHTEQFLIRTFEIDRLKQATLPTLVRLMHEAAMQNVIDLKLSVWDLEEKGISWVLLRQRLEIERLPRLGERVSVVTHPSGFDKFFTYRDFRVYDEHENQIAWASSTWVLMDMHTRKVRRLPPFILDYEAQMPEPGLCLPRPNTRIPPLSHPSGAREYQVQYYDLDFNQHLNNTLYLKWMLESLPDPLLMQGKCRSVHLEYRAECRWMAHVRAESEEVGRNTFIHRLCSSDEGKDLAFARTVWEV